MRVLTILRYHRTFLAAYRAKVAINRVTFNRQECTRIESVTRQRY